jgi:hypothetical protein
MVSIITGGSAIGSTVETGEVTDNAITLAKLDLANLGVLKVENVVIDAELAAGAAWTSSGDVTFTPSSANAVLLAAQMNITLGYSNAGGNSTWAYCGIRPTNQIIQEGNPTSAEMEWASIKCRTHDTAWDTTRTWMEWIATPFTSAGSLFGKASPNDLVLNDQNIADGHVYGLTGDTSYEVRFWAKYDGTQGKVKSDSNVNILYLDIE